MPRLEDVGEICLRRPRPTQGCRADDADDDDDGIKYSTVKPRFTNASDREQFRFEQIFGTQSGSDDVLCLELRKRKPSTSWSDKLGESTSAIFAEE